MSWWHSVTHAVSSTVDTVAKTTTDAANTVAKTTTDAANTVAKTTTDAANTVAKGATDAANAVADTATDAYNATADFAESLVNDTTKAVQHAEQVCEKNAKEYASQGWDVTTSEWKTCQNAVTHAVTDGVEYVEYAAEEAYKWADANACYLGLNFALTTGCVMYFTPKPDPADPGTVNSTAIAAGANLVINSSSVYLLSSASSTNTVISSNSYVVGNTTVNTTITPISFITGNSTVTATVNNTVIAIGNSSVNTTANSTNLKTSTVEVTTNTGLTVGNSSSAANGYTFLPNGFKLNWGWVSANSSDGNVTFSSSYTTNCWSVTATSNTTTDTYQAAVISVNSSVAEIRTANATSTNVLWIAIGT